MRMSGLTYTMSKLDIIHSRNPLISLMRDKMVLQLQLIMPGSVSMTLYRKYSAECTTNTGCSRG